MINPNAIPFSRRIGNWLEVLRIERLKPPTKRLSEKKESAFMKKLLAKMSPEQMAGYLKGLN